MQELQCWICKMILRSLKVCTKDFPLGSFKGQKTPGFSMSELLKENLDILAEKIVDDMQFVGII